MATDAQTVLQDVADWFGLGRDFARNSVEQWEHLADEYYAETGRLRPGKDPSAVAMLSEDERRAEHKLWQAWSEQRKEALFERVRAALQTLEGDT